MFQHFYRTFHIQIFSLKETHINIDEPNDLFHISWYQFISKLRAKGCGGDVAAFISDRFKDGQHWKRCEDLEIDEIECLW